MIVYKIQNDMSGMPNSVLRSDGWVIPFVPANTDYANFKAQINADEAQLRDAEDRLMSPEEAKAYVATLP